MKWVEKTQSNNIYAETSESLNGNKVVRAGLITSGLPITLQDNFGVFTHAQVDAITTMCNTIIATYPLEFDNGKVIQVRFAHENKPAWEFTGVWDLIYLQRDVAFKGTLKLITV